MPSDLDGSTGVGEPGGLVPVPAQVPAPDQARREGIACAHGIDGLDREARHIGSPLRRDDGYATRAPLQDDRLDHTVVHQLIEQPFQDSLTRPVDRLPGEHRIRVRCEGRVPPLLRPDDDIDKGRIERSVRP